MSTPSWVLGAAFILAILVLIVITVAATTPRPVSEELRGNTQTLQLQRSRANLQSRLGLASQTVTDLDSAEHAAELLRGPHAAAVLVYGNYCDHCKAMMPDFAQAATQVSSTLFAKLDADQFASELLIKCPELPPITALPTLLINPGAGKAIRKLIGRKNLPQLLSNVAIDQGLVSY